jgi:hypothetical protein
MALFLYKFSTLGGFFRGFNAYFLTHQFDKYPIHQKLSEMKPVFDLTLKKSALKKQKPPCFKRRLSNYR